MKKIFFIFTIVLLLTGVGCSGQNEQTQQIPVQNQEIPISVPNNYPEAVALHGNEYQSIQEDLNGDGEKETVTLAVERGNGNVTAVLHVDNNSVVVPGDDPAGYFGVVALDKKDGLKEIAVGDFGPSDDYTTTFYYYDGTQLVSMGTIEGLYEDMNFDGKGMITTKTRGKILDTWFYDDNYTISKDRQLVHMPKNLYTRDTSVTLLISLRLQLSPENDQVVTTLQKGEAVKIIGCDDKTWCEIKKTNGTTGWFAIEDFDTIQGTNGLHGQDVFSGLSYAD